MESLQLAQMLADLSDLNAAQEARAALAVVTANKTLPTAPPASPSPSPEHPAQAAPANKFLEQSQRDHQRVTRTASPATFDKFGRRIISPPLSRTNSATGTPGTSTPLRRESEVDLDVAQATSLMQLYEIRAKLKQQDNSSLLKAREKINALRQYQSQSPITSAERHATPDVPQTRFTYPRTSA
ncbi:hypothetical protein NKR19_g9079 [Coniochaeta hoffmannii]|uniref:Uncharacterized protein n=1 Tax=Coniochaeta hoffmannii TaxID=91930 RepID=A0AA38RDK2_9PEZI|nr:hypothetical protein NKR19_g9079 [Coniochaeta hoffmannii]